MSVSGMEGDAEREKGTLTQTEKETERGRCQTCYGD